MRLAPILLALTAGLLPAQDDPFAEALGGSHVKASLVSEGDGVVAGQPFTVALKMEHDEGWHTYWLNPGTGLPVSVQWTLPEGFTAGPIVWPIPHVIEGPIGNLHSYEHTAYLLTEITPPATLAAGAEIALAGDVKWQVCNDSSCVPGSETVSLKLSAKAPTINAAMKKEFDAVRAQQAKTTDAWKVEFTEVPAAGEEPAKVSFLLVPGDGANPDPGMVYFFDASKVLESDPQKPMLKDGKLLLSIARKDVDEGEKPPVPAGFFHASKGWLKDGSLPALAFGAPGAETPSAEKKPVAATPAATKESFDKSEWELDASPEDYVEYRDDLTVSDLRAGGAAGPQRGFLEFLLLIFLGGMILNLMPCVFPVLGIKILGFARLAGQNRRKLLLHAAAFTAGIVVFVWVLGIALELIERLSGRELTWGALTQNPLGLGIVIALLFVLGLNLWGLFELGTSLTSVGGELQDKKGYAGSFWSGALTTIVSTPCSGPFLGPAMFYTLSQPVLPQFALLTAFGLGIAFPYIFFSAFPALIKKLPRPGPWMETFKKALAFPMFAAVIYFLNGYMKLTGAWGTTLILCSLLVLAIAAWIYGHWATPFREARTKWTGRFAALATLGGGAWLLAQGAAERAPALALTDEWEQWSPRRIRELRLAGKPVFVDYTTYG